VASAILAKRGRDPERPKRPISAWLFFLAAFRKDKKNKNVDAKQVLLEAAKSWKTLSAAQQKPHIAAAKKETDAYAKAFKKYQDSGRAEYWKRDPNRPKRPTPTVTLFSAEKKYAVPEGAKAWKDLSPAKQKPYQEKFAKAFQAFTKKMAAYKASGSEEKWKTAVGIKALEDAEESKNMKVTEKAAALKEKAKAKLQQEKDKARAMKVKEMAKAKALKEKEKATALKAKEKAKKLKVKEMALAKSLKAKEKSLKEKERAKALKVKEVAKAKALKEKAKAMALKEKASAKAQALKTVKKTVTKAVKKTAAQKQAVPA